METKLTLSLDSEIIKKAKRYAKNRHTSLSSIVEDFFYYLTVSENEKEKSTLSNTPITDQLLGVIKPEKDPDQLKEQYLMEKYISE
jgi:hypothetical protein